MAFFSIIVPVYNTEKYLPQCVSSILGQTFGDFELLLIDDESPDGSGALCDGYAEKDPRVRVIHQKNGGLSNARNSGLKAASGEYILFLDSDDFWHRSDALELIRREFVSTGADVVLLKHHKLDVESSQLLSCSDPLRPEDLLGRSYGEQLSVCVSTQLYDTCAWNKAFRRSLMEGRDLFFTEGIIAEDIDWAARLALAASRISLVAEPVHTYRKGRPGAITTSLKLQNLIDTKGSLERCIAYMVPEKRDRDFLDAYYSYVAYRYVIWMAESAVVQDSGKRALIHQMKQHKWLLCYHLNRKVKLAYRVSLVAGWRMSAKLLGLYLSMK